MKREKLKESYIYFAKSQHFLNGMNMTETKAYYAAMGLPEQAQYARVIKMGETGSYGFRSRDLKNKYGMIISRRVKFVGTKDERLFIEGYVRSTFAHNTNMRHSGNDYFTCSNINTIKGAERSFFEIVAQGFEILSEIKKKNFSWECEIVS